MAEPVDGSYSQVADEQLDAIESSGSPALYNAILNVCDLIFADPSRARQLSTAITTKEGIRLRMVVPGHFPYKVFWSSPGPRVESVFPYEGH
jgi:hypothetical protein